MDGWMDGWVVGGLVGGGWWVGGWVGGRVGGWEWYIKNLPFPITGLNCGVDICTIY